MMNSKKTYPLIESDAVSIPGDQNPAKNTSLDVGTIFNI